MTEGAATTSLDYARPRRPAGRREGTRGAIVHGTLALVPWFVVGLCCGLPVLWLVVELATRADVWHAAWPDAFRLRLIGRTFAYDAIAATLATALAVPVALSLSRRGLRWLWLLVPVPLLMPSLVLTYGWKQLLIARGAEQIPQSAGDVARCVGALASWLWPAPAMLVAYAVRRLDPNVIQQARLDGAVGRTVARLLAGPAVLGWTLALLLAFQEFAVFEPTGISVIATEVRSVFETGASLDGSWTPPTLPTSRGEEHQRPSRADQPARTAAALAVMLPVLLVTGVLMAGLARAGQALGDDAGDVVHDAAVRAPGWFAAVASLAALAAVGLPVGAMVMTMRSRFEPARIVNEYEPQLVGSISLALATAAVAACVGVAAAVRRPGRAVVALALAGFLIGGQWAAIALIHQFNQPWLRWVYDSPALAVIAYLCRFGWIALVAAALTWSANVRWLRDLAATDGAGPWRTWLGAVAPTTWPLLLAGVVLVFTLSLTEVPATTLLQPADTLVPMLMTWAHVLNYDAMMEACLLLTLVVMTLGGAAAWMVRRVVRAW